MSSKFLKPMALAIAVSLFTAGCAQQAQTSDVAADGSVASAATSGATVASASSADQTPVFDISELDKSIDACTDFNGFVNAKWLAANPIPADQTRWGSFNLLREKSLDDQHQIVKAAASHADSAENGSLEQKVGWFFRSGMDTDAINSAGYAPIKPELASIAALKSSNDVEHWLDQAFARGDGQVFHFGSSADYKDAKRQIGFTFQGGLGLPTPDYYTKDDYKTLRQAYVKHIAKMFELTGVPANEAKARADQVLAFETALAKHSLSRVELRDPENQYHLVTVAEADKITPHFDWKQFFTAQGVTVEKGFSMGQPKFFKQFDKLLADAPVDQWKAYLAFHAIDDASPYLSKPFQDANFAFYGTTLNGQPEQRPRWKRVLSAVNRGMGMGLGELYVARYFPPQAKARAEELVANVRNALKARIENLAWMSDATKAKAIAKWETFLPKIGYPDEGQWRDWSGLKITPDNYYANVRAAHEYNYRYEIGKIGKPTNRKEWGMTPQTVNAYYNPSDNTINFPAAILQPPFFYAHGDDAINYGGIGAVIGHEASHGFDDQGSQFDGQGNLSNWWTKADREKFDARAQKLVDQFNSYVPMPKEHPDKHVNGKLTLGENIADLGGLNVAYDALQVALKNNPQEAGKKIDGLTQDQRFFLNWARVWRGETRPERQLVLLNADPHSPAQFRAIGAPSDMPAFAEAFNCQPGDKMVRSGDERVQIW
ncbi:MAG TPA: M13 family metallopeptidase [Rhodanobacteraceae bacterium]|nr:M13 family metallopeptidase [Rhodanobacteraceae bacterium]